MALNLREHLVDFMRFSYVRHDRCSETSNSRNFIDCALGTNPYGYPQIIDEAVNLLGNIPIDKYPDPLYKELKRKIADYWREVAHIKEPNIKVGNGSIGILEKLNKVFVDKGSRVLGYCPQFPDFMTDVECNGGTYQYIALKPRNNFKFDCDEMVSAMNRDHRLVYIDNPNNPTGQVIPISIVEHIVKQAEKMGICVVVDEAYGDFMDKENSAICLINKYNNLVVLRSFSKGFGLAGIRVGYMVTGELIANYYSKVDSPFTVTAYGKYLAKLALEDREFAGYCRKRIKDAKQKIIKCCTKMRVLETDPEVPIMTLVHPDKDVDLYEEFAKYGVLTESGEDFMGLGKNYVRFRIPLEMDRVIDIINKIEGEFSY